MLKFPIGRAGSAMQSDIEWHFRSSMQVRLAALIFNIIGSPPERAVSAHWWEDKALVRIDA